jgi:hypothetical protein
MIDSSSILSYMTSVCLGDGTWKGSSEAFITHWTNQVRLYERQVPPSDYFSDGQKRVMLETAVGSIPKLRQVKNSADLEKTCTGHTLTFDEYSSLLLSASAAYDVEFKTKFSKHLTYAHDSYYSHDVFEPTDAPYHLLCLFMKFKPMS